MAAERERTGFLLVFLFWPWNKVTAVCNNLVLVVFQWKSRGKLPQLNNYKIDMEMDVIIYDCRVNLIQQ